MSTLLRDRGGAFVFSHTQKVSISHFTFLHHSNMQCNWCFHTPRQPAKNLLLPMVQNVMCHWWQGTHYSPSEICTLKIWRRQQSLGCGTAYQLLPRSPTSKIHGLSWKPLSHAPQGVRRSSTTSPRVRGCHWGGSLAIGIARFTVTPLITGGQHTHTPYSCGVVLVFFNLAGNKFWYIRT